MLEIKFKQESPKVALFVNPPPKWATKTFFEVATVEWTNTKKNTGVVAMAIHCKFMQELTIFDILQF